ncbi:MAG: hypothetical protein GWP14_02485 [Actinobacteria bacterium]|nr:hypothetical protein [Actinomycetota bacterium]
MMTGLTLAGSLVAYATGAPKEAKYVGTNKCRMCHMKSYKTWKGTKHAKNFDVLQGNEVTNPDCLKCHTTGYGQPGGFVSAEATPGLKGTGCESCHGPGSEHIKAGKVADKSGPWDKKIDKTPMNACVKCHNPHINQKARAEKLRAAAQ